MSDLFKKPNCWFSHAQTQIVIEYQTYQVCHVCVTLCLVHQDLFDYVPGITQCVLQVLHNMSFML